MHDADPVLDDPGELMRFWLWHQKHIDIVSFTIAHLANESPLAVGAWLGRRRGIPTKHWNAIARYFERESYHELVDEARRLWADLKHRRGYVPLYKLKAKRRRRIRNDERAAARRNSTARPKGDFQGPPRLLKFESGAWRSRSDVTRSSSTAAVLPWRTAARGRRRRRSAPARTPRTDRE
jgi:hypothetical protein